MSFNSRGFDGWMQRQMAALAKAFPLPAASAAPKVSPDEFRIAKLELRPGDILVLKFLRPVTVASQMQTAETFRRFVPEHRVVVIDADTDLSVVRQAAEREDGL
jgi:hypothetical protein